MKVEESSGRRGSCGMVEKSSRTGAKGQGSGKRGTKRRETVGRSKKSKRKRVKGIGRIRRFYDPYSGRYSIPLGQLNWGILKCIFRLMLRGFFVSLVIDSEYRYALVLH